MAKKTLGVCLAASMVVGSVGSGAVSYMCMVEDVYASDVMTYTVGDSTYKYVVNDDGDTCEIIRYKGSDTEINIPDEIDGKSVTSIGDSAFRGCSSLTSIVIPTSVMSIGRNALGDCDKNKLVISCHKDSKAYKYAVDEGYKYKLLDENAKSTIKLNKSAVTLNPTKKITLTSTVSPKGTKVTWKSSKTSVATVSSKGVVTAKKAGTAVITATTSDGVKDTCKVTVMNAPKSIKLNKTKVTINKRQNICS